MAVCSGGAGLAPEDRAELQAILAKDADEIIADRAQNALLSVPPEAFVAAVEKEDAAPQLLEYCAEERGQKPGIADALANNRNCPPALLARVAKYFSAATVQKFLDNIQYLSDTPDLAGALAESPMITAEQRASLEELLKQDGDEAVLREALRDIDPDEKKRETMPWIAAAALVSCEWISSGFYLGDIWMRHYGAMWKDNIAAREMGEFIKNSPVLCG